MAGATTTLRQLFLIMGFLVPSFIALVVFSPKKKGGNCDQHSWEDTALLVSFKTHAKHWDSDKVTIATDKTAYYKLHRLYCMCVV